MIDGILPVVKPRGISSAQAVAKLKRAYNAKKAGHGGALDPLADGLLVVLFGDATGFARFCLGADKGYRARVRFGAQTETDDSEGKVLFSSIPPPDLMLRVQQFLPQFIGEIQQTAPQYSALKDKGEPLYKKARRGETITTKTRTMQVADIKIVNDDNNKEENTITFDIRAQGGFYVRAFARDLGIKLGCGAHLSGLTRTASGVLSLADATPLHTLTDNNQSNRIFPIDKMLTYLPKDTLPINTIAKIAHGQFVNLKNNNNETPTRIYTPYGRFAGIIEGNPPKPVRLLQWTRTEIPLPKTIN